MDHSFAFEAIGTSWRIETYDALSVQTVDQVVSRAELFDVTYSRFRPDSLVSEVARHPGVYRFPDDATALFDLYRQLYDCTDGAFTPLLGGALEHLGYGADYRLQRRAGRIGVPEWDEVLEVDGSVVSTNAPVLLDVGAAGKGFLVDLIAEILDLAGVHEYVVDASGDLIHRGSTAETVGLEDPSDSQQVIGVANVGNAALCASATNRRRWGNGLHHILDPATGEPSQGVLATWVVSRSCAVADGLATALFVADPLQLARVFDYSYVRLSDNRDVDFSINFDGKIFD